MSAAAGAQTPGRPPDLRVTGSAAHPPGGAARRRRPPMPSPLARQADFAWRVAHRLAGLLGAFCPRAVRQGGRPVQAFGTKRRAWRPLAHNELALRSDSEDDLSGPGALQCIGRVAETRACKVQTGRLMGLRLLTAQCVLMQKVSQRKALRSFPRGMVLQELRAEACSGDSLEGARVRARMH